LEAIAGYVLETGGNYHLRRKIRDGVSGTGPEVSDEACSMKKGRRIELEVVA